jgi:probable HAF family extracellular repeat protein
MLAGGVASYATDINSSGDVVGYTRFLDGTYEATVWDDGVAIALGMLSGDSNSLALAINDAGQIAGWSFGPGQAHATLWVDPVLQTPLPATLPLFATGLLGLVLLGWRRNPIC